jgi:glutathione peroxidase
MFVRVGLTSLLLGAFPRAARSASSGSCPLDAHPGSLLRFRGLAGGAPILPSSLAGRPALIVNTASYCGYTPQLKSLQALHERFSPRGLAVVGVPCNDFGAQEPDEEPAILAAYRAQYGVTFPLAAKYSVVGGEAHPFFLHLQHRLGDAGAPHWNFQKYLVGRDGQIAGLFDPSMDPLADEVVSAVEDALEAQLPDAGRGEEL